MNREQMNLHIEYLRTVNSGAGAFVHVPRLKLLAIAHYLERLRDSLDAMQPGASATPQGGTQDACGDPRLA